MIHTQPKKQGNKERGDGQNWKEEGGGIRVIGGLHKIGAVGKRSTLKAVVTRKQSTPNFPKN